MGPLVFLLAMAQAAPVPPRPFPPAQAQPFLQRLIRKHGKIGTDRVTAYDFDGCASTLATATGNWRLDWTKARPTKAIIVNQGGRIAIPLAGDEGFIRDSSGSPVASLEIGLPMSDDALFAVFMADGLAVYCHPRD
jgi:hypothetical protein